MGREANRRPARWVEGSPASFEFDKADVHSVLRLLAEVKHVNLTVADDVQGRVTLRLLNVTADEAFRAVLQARGLGAEQTGSIVRVAPLATLAAEAEQRAKLEHARLLEGPLETTLIPVSYANAADLAPKVKEQLSERGTVSVDERTNTLIVRDVAPRR